MDHPLSKEIAMFRIFAVATILVLGVSAAQAEDTLNTRVHNAAAKACAAKVGASLPITFYRAVTAHCTDRVSNDALASIRARQVAKAEASTAAN
jgi:hypothetical protein